MLHVLRGCNCYIPITPAVTQICIALHCDLFLEKHAKRADRRHLPHCSQRCSGAVLHHFYSFCLNQHYNEKRHVYNSISNIVIHNTFTKHIKMKVVTKLNM